MEIYRFFKSVGEVSKWKPEYIYYFPSYLDPDIRQKFDDEEIRKGVSRVVIKYMEFLGFIITELKITSSNHPSLYEVKILKNQDINIYSLEIKKILGFLRFIDMKLLSMLFFLGICKMKMKNNLILPIFKDFMDLSNLKGLSFDNNSCYMDSVLFCLFAIPNKLMENEILYKNLVSISKNNRKWISCGKTSKEDYYNRLEIQNELKNIVNFMRTDENKNSEYTCTDLRKLIENCPTSQKFHSDEEQDAGEFLQYIFNIFEVKTTRIKRTTIVTNDLSDNLIENDYIQTHKQIDDTTPIITISVFDLKSDSYYLSNSLFVQEDSLLDYENRYRDSNTGRLFKRRIEINKVIDSEFLVFYVQRLNYDGRRNTTEILLEENIEIGDRTLYLYGIIVHKSRHYTAYIKDNGVWYYYDDIKDGRINRVDSIENTNAFKLGTLFFYKS